MARQNLLIVDADVRNRRVLEVSLRKAGFSITAAESAEKALEFLEHAAPDLIISDTHLPGEDGFAFCTQIKGNPRWRSIPFIFLTSEKSVDEKVRGLKLGVEDYLTKPIYVKEITTRVTMLLQRKQHERLERRDTARTKFTGRLADMAVVDLLQTIEISRKSGVIHFGTELGEARVWFREGALVDAEMGRLQGEAAVYRLLSLSDGEFELEFKPVNRSQVIEANTQALLMDGMRRVDEWGRLMEQLPPLETVLTVNHDVYAQRRDDLSSGQLTTLRLFDGRRSIIEVVDDSGQDDLEVMTAICTFYFEGLLTVTGEPGEPPLAEESGSLQLEDWDAPRRARTPQPVAVADPGPSESSNPELPPPPSYPEPFPQLQTDAEEDVLVAGIPEDSAPRPAFGASMVPLEEGGARTESAPPDRDVLRALRAQLDAIEAGDEDVLDPPENDDEGVEGESGPPLREGGTGSPQLTVIPGLSAERTQAQPLARLALKRLRVPPPGGGEASVGGPEATTQPPPEEEPRISPLGEPMRPPTGVPRASASGIFHTDGTPRPDPPRVPRSARGRLGLEETLDAKLGVSGPGVEEPSTLELYKAPGRSGTAASPETSDLDDGAPVRVPRPAQESGPWARRATDRPAAAERDLEVETDPIERGLPTESSATAVSRSAARVPYGAIAVVAVLVVFAGVVLGFEHRKREVAAAAIRHPAPEAPLPAVEPPPPEADLALAQDLYRRGDVEGARRVLGAVLQERPRDAPALVLRSTLWVEEGDLDEALRVAEASVSADPQYADAHLAVGVIQQERGALQPAADAYRTYLELAPDGFYSGAIRRQLDHLQARLEPTPTP